MATFLTVLTGLLKSTTFLSTLVLVLPQIPNVIANPRDVTSWLTILGTIGAVNGRINAAGPLLPGAKNPPAA